MPRYVLAFDLGGTNVRGGIVGEDGEILCRGRDVSGQRPSGEEVAGKMAAIADGCLKERGLRREDIVAVGIGSPGPLDSRTGIVIETPNLGWKNVPLAKLVQERIGRPTFLENDANCACWGEFWKGAARGSRTAFILTLGTGVGGGLILDGKLYKGIDDTGGHLGHIVVNSEGPPHWALDNPGSLEAYCSATACIRDARAAAKAHPDSLLARKPADQIDGAFVAACAEQGDAAAREIWRKLGYHLGVACATLANTLNPEVGVIGGGLCQAWDLFAEPMEAECRRRALSTPGARLKLRRAELVDDAGIVGAAGLALERL